MPERKSVGRDTAKLDEAKTVRAGEELDVVALEKCLREHGIEGNAALLVEQFPSGYSNLTYLLQFGARELVLRRPPFGNQVKSAHDMGREYRVLSKLCEVFEPAPRPLLFCDDHSVLGDEFYVMERRQGVILRGPHAPEPLSQSPKQVRALSQAFVQNLARLHQLDYTAAGLGDLGKPEGYVDRQVGGWTKRFENARTEATPHIDQLAQWLSQNKPTTTTTSLIHNDYKYDNLVLDPNDLTRIVALLDWEMATIGDPLMDLGTSLAYWIEATDSEEQKSRAFGPTMAEGSLTRQALVDEYARAANIEIVDLLFYYCFGIFKLAGIVQQIYARYARGATKDPRFAQLNHVVTSLGVAATQALDTGKI